MLQTSIGGGDRISMTIWRHMKHTASMPVDAGVHEADLLRYYMGEFRLVYGESRLHEKVRHKGEPGHGGGPGGFYGGYRDTMPEQIEPTGDDALYAHIAFRSGATGHWIDDHAGHGQRRDERVVYGSRGSFLSTGNRSGRPITLHLDGGREVDGRGGPRVRARLPPLAAAAELFGGERVWTYDLRLPRDRRPPDRPRVPRARRVHPHGGRPR